MIVLWLAFDVAWAATGIHFGVPLWLVVPVFLYDVVGRLREERP